MPDDDKKLKQVKNPIPEEIYALMTQAPNEKEKTLISRAFGFAQKAHEGQKRNSGEPYFFHVFEVGKNLARLGMDAKTISAGLLHDVLEDTETSEESMEKEFGKEIVSLVNGVTKLGKVKYKGKERHVESLRKFFMAVSEDIRILIIKLADRLHNIQTLQYVRPDKQKRIALETIEIHAPLADRLGMGKLKGELEDCAFPYAFPKEYKQVEDLLKQRSILSHTYLENVHKKLQKELALQGVKVIKTDYRIKHKYSLYKKLVFYKMDIDRIYDIVALRVIVPNIEDCYRVLGIIHALWKPLPGRIKDYIALPKPNGYQSLHTTIFTGNGSESVAEIQIRTEDMHREAEYGIASHFLYTEGKVGNGSTKKLDEKFAWINNLKELENVEGAPMQFLEHLKMDFFKHRIFIFTPEGDVVDLPEDSSPIDFAYAIHSDIGNHASGAKINGKFSALNTKLKNADIVEIIVKKESHPTSKWMDFAKTTMAKKHIKQYVQENSLLSRFFGRSKF